MVEIGVGIWVAFAFGIVIVVGFALFWNRRKRQQLKDLAQIHPPFTNKDRELLELINDLAEMYRSTGR